MLPTIEGNKSNTATTMTRLEEYAGVDVRHGLRVLRGDREKLISLLRLMAASHLNDMQEFISCRQRGAHQDAHRIVHTLKGVAATLGAKALSNAARELESRLRENPEIADGELRGHMTAVTLQLERLTEVVEKPEPVKT